MFSYFASRRTISCKKLPSSLGTYSAIPSDISSPKLRYLKPRITSSRYLLYFAVRFSLVNSAIQLQFGTTWQTIGLLWHFFCGCSSKHFGAFFHDSNPFVMNAASLFPSAVKVTLSCVEKLKQNTVSILKHNCRERSNSAFLNYTLNGKCFTLLLKRR